ncbi:MAG: glycosyltransferase family 4 protein, partial [Patescibacteria group bacterium]|nr:glycosyltransferase family 4 protein [Patescibacteria group bacterium]
MKIIILSDRIAPILGGAIGVAYQQARGLAQRGHAVTVLAGSGTVPPEAKFSVRTVPAAFHPRYAGYLGLHNPAAARQVRQMLAELQPDVVHAHNIYHALSYRCLVEARRVTPRVFLTAHDVMSFAYAKLTHFINPADMTCPARPSYHTPWQVNFSTARKQYNPFRNGIIRRRLARITKVFAVSQALADALSDNGIRNVAVVRNGIDVNDWPTLPADAVRNFRRQFKLENRKILFFSGRLSGAKGIHQVLLALAQVVRREPSALLLIAGDVEDGRGYEALPKKYGVENHVVFAGRLDAAAMALAYHVSD